MVGRTEYLNRTQEVQLEAQDVEVSVGSVRLDDETKQPHNVQNPLPTNGDTVYEKDLNKTTGTTIGTFIGDISTLVNNYDVSIVDNTTTNPKTFTLRFARPISINQIAFGSSSGGNFSNVKIQFKDLGGVIRGEIDDSANNTKETSKLYPFVANNVISKVIFIEMVVEFYTIDPVDIVGIYMPKLGQTESIIMGYDEATGLPTYLKFDNNELIIGGATKSKDSANQIIDPAIKQKQNTISDYQDNNIEEAGAGITYFGKETPDGDWLLVKIDESVSPVDKTWANVSNNATRTSYNLAWINRATLTYINYGGLIF